MDSHNIGRGRGSARAALEAIRSRALVIGIDSDILFTHEDQAFLAQHLPNSELKTIDSVYGHDGFLIEGEAISKHLGSFLERW
jgi:homoserine O-acetyltransferase